MLPHGYTEVEDLAVNSTIIDLAPVAGWSCQQWELSTDDVDRVVSAYQAIVAVDVDDEIDAMLTELAIDPLGPRPKSEQHAKVARADATELASAATVVAYEGIDIANIYMPNVPKMSTQKSDSGIDVLGIELTPGNTGEPQGSERLVVVSVKHTISSQASGMRSKLEASVTDDFSHGYLYRQLVVLHGRMVQEGIPEATASRVFYFLRDALKNPKVRIVCVAVASPEPDCNLPRQPALLTDSGAPDRHFRMVLVPELPTLHEKLVP